MAENLENKKTTISDNGGYKRLNELKKDDVKNLEQVQFTVKVNKTKFGVTYQGTIPFGKGHLNFRLDETAVLTISAIRRIEFLSRETTIPAFVRYVKGIDKNGNEYHQAQLLVASGCYFTSLIESRLLRLMDLWVQNDKTIKPIKWIDVATDQYEDGLGYFEE